jgi:hypothetical protein
MYPSWQGPLPGTPLRKLRLLATSGVPRELAGQPSLLACAHAALVQQASIEQAVADAVFW